MSLICSLALGLSLPSGLCIVTEETHAMWLLAVEKIML